MTLVAGPAGIGKTMLTLAALARSRRSMRRVCSLAEVESALKKTRRSRASTVDDVAASMAAWADDNDSVLFFDDVERLPEDDLEGLIDRLHRRDGPGRFVFASRRLTRRSAFVPFEVPVPAADDALLARIAARRAPDLARAEIQRLVERAGGSPRVLSSLIAGRPLDAERDPLEGLARDEQELLRDLRSFPEGITLVEGAGELVAPAPARLRTLEREGLIVVEEGRLRLSSFARATIDAGWDQPSPRVNDLALRVLRGGHPAEALRAIDVLVGSRRTGDPIVDAVAVDTRDTLLWAASQPAPTRRATWNAWLEACAFARRPLDDAAPPESNDDVDDEADLDASRVALARYALATSSPDAALAHLATPTHPRTLAMRARVLVELGAWEEAHAAIAEAKRHLRTMPPSFHRDLAEACFSMGDLDGAHQLTTGARPGTCAARRHALIALHRFVERGELADARRQLEELREDPFLGDEERAECEVRALRLESVGFVTPELVSRIRRHLAKCRELGAASLVTTCAWLEIHCSDVHFVRPEIDPVDDPTAVTECRSAVPVAMLRLIRELVGREPPPGSFAHSLRPRLAVLPAFVAGQIILVLTRDAVLAASDSATRSLLRDAELVLARVEAAGLRFVAFEVEASVAIARLLLRRHEDLASSLRHLRGVLEPVGPSRFAVTVGLLEAATTNAPDVRWLAALAIDPEVGPRSRVVARALLGDVEPGASDAAIVTAFVQFDVAVYGQRPPSFEAGLVFDGTTQRLLLADRTADLTGHPVAVAILRELFVHGTVSKEDLALRVWGVARYHPHRDDTRIRVAIRRLRALVEADAGRPSLVCTEAEGYRIAAPLRRWIELKAPPRP